MSVLIGALGTLGGDRMPTEAIKLYASETASLHQLQPTESFYNENPAVLKFIQNKQTYKDTCDQLLIKFESIDKKYLSKKFVQSDIYLYIESYPNSLESNRCIIFFLEKNYSLKDRSFAADYQELPGDYLVKLIFNDGWVNFDLQNKSLETILNGLRLEFRCINIPNEVSYVITAGNIASNRPYLSVVLDDPDIKINPNPSGGFVDEKKENIFSWDFDTNSIGGKSALTLQSTTLQWRNGDDGVINTIDIDGGALSCAFEPNTFPNTSTLQYKVTLNFAEGYSSESSWVNLTTIDTVPSASIVYPKSVYIDGSIKNRFSWNYIIETGSLQYGATLQYSNNNGLSWEQFGTVSGSETSYEVPENTLPAGTILWKVQVTNSDGQQSEWSAPATIVVRNAPVAPILSIKDNSPRPTINWQAIGQESYQVVVGDYDSGEIYGTEKTYKVPVYLPDGNVDISVRIKNAFGIWSDWSKVNTNIVNVNIGNIRLNAKSKKYNIILNWTYEGQENAELYYVYRDGDLIAKTIETVYIDNTAYGVHSYFIRGVIGDYYTISNLTDAKLDIHTACIAVYGEWDWIDLQIRRGSMPSLTTQYSGSIFYQHFVGRKLPVAEIGDERDISWSFAFSAVKKDNIKKMDNLFGKLVVYKDPRDGLCIGIMDAQQKYSDVSGWDMTYTIHAIDYHEDISYDL